MASAFGQMEISRGVGGVGTRRKHHLYIWILRQSGGNEHHKKIGNLKLSSTEIPPNWLVLQATNTRRIHRRHSDEVCAGSY